jgi:hypothetical protein
VWFSRYLSYNRFRNSVLVRKWAQVSQADSMRQSADAHGHTVALRLDGTKWSTTADLTALRLRLVDSACAPAVL